eukprot:5712100-Amphidinium_carterae.1
MGVGASASIQQHCSCCKSTDGEPEDAVRPTRLAQAKTEMQRQPLVGTPYVLPHLHPEAVTDHATTVSYTHLRAHETEADL